MRRRHDALALIQGALDDFEGIVVADRGRRVRVFWREIAVVDQSLTQGIERHPAIPREYPFRCATARAEHPRINAVLPHFLAIQTTGGDDRVDDIRRRLRLLRFRATLADGVHLAIDAHIARRRRVRAVAECARRVECFALLPCLPLRAALDAHKPRTVGSLHSQRRLAPAPHFAGRHWCRRFLRCVRMNAHSPDGRRNNRHRDSNGCRVRRRCHRLDGCGGLLRMARDQCGRVNAEPGGNGRGRGAHRCFGRFATNRQLHCLDRRVECGLRHIGFGHGRIAIDGWPHTWTTRLRAARLFTRTPVARR